MADNEKMDPSDPETAPLCLRRSETMTDVSLKAIEIRTPQKRPYFSFTSNSKIRGKAY